MSSRTMALRLVVRYEDQDSPAVVPDEQVCKDLLDDLVKIAVNRGLLTNETDLVVESYSHNVETIGVYQDDQCTDQ